MESLPRAPLGLATTSTLADELLTLGSWSGRLALLRRHPELAHPVIADRSDASGAGQLARFLRRASDVGLDDAVKEVQVLETLEQQAADPADGSIAALQVAASLILDGAEWLVPEFLEAGIEVSHRHPALSDRLRSLSIPPLAHATGTTVVDVQQAIALACMEWEDVWPLLDSICAKTHLTDALPAAREAALLSADMPDLHGWVSELQGLIDAARGRGVEAAEYEHRLRSVARGLADGEGLEEFDEPDVVCSQLASEMARLWQETGATWLLPEAIEVARQTVKLTDPNSPQRAGRLSNLSGLIGEGVQAGVCPPGRLDEALSAAREALTIGSEDPDIRARLAATLGNRISQAVDAGLVEGTMLLEAVALHTTAWELTGPGSPARSQRASNLGSLLATAIEAGILPATELQRALELQSEAVAAAGDREADLPWLLSNRANLIAQAVQFSILDPDALLDGIVDLRRALAIAAPGHPIAAGVSSNLSSLLAEGIHAGVVPDSRIPEAILLAREALNSTPEPSPDWPRYATNLANRLGLGVTAGFEPLTSLAEAVALAERALRTTPTGHPSKAARTANLIGRVLAAVGAGVLPAERVDGLVDLAESMWLATPPSHPLRARLASDTAVLLSEAVKQGVLEPARLLDAVAIGMEGQDLLRPDNPDWPESMSNLAAIISDAVHCPASRTWQGFLGLKGWGSSGQRSPGAPRVAGSRPGIRAGVSMACVSPMRCVRRVVHNDASLDQCCTHGFALNTHPTTDGPHRDARSGEAHSLRLLVKAEPWSATRHVATAEVGEHRGAVDAIPFGQGLDTHPGQVVTDKLVHLGGSEKSLSRLDSPHDRPPIVPRSATLGSCGHLVDTPQ